MSEPHYGIGQFKSQGEIPKVSASRIWCECCRMHFDVDHFPNGMHGVGVDYGPYGLLLWESVELTRLQKFVQWLEWRLHLVIGGQCTDEELQIIKGHLEKALPFEAPE